MSWIQTRNAHKFDFSDIENSVIDVDDIAHALAHLCRYNGHCERFYSVGEHVVRASFLAEHLGLDYDVQYAALHHDDAEAYTGDITRPLKAMLYIVDGWDDHNGDRFPDSYAPIKAFENKVDARCRRALKVIWNDTIAARVKDLDNAMLLAEKAVLHKQSAGVTWDPIPVPFEYLTFATGLMMDDPPGWGFNQTRVAYEERDAELRDRLGIRVP
jgi:hypothetical protein